MSPRVIAVQESGREGTGAWSWPAPSSGSAEWHSWSSPSSRCSAFSGEFRVLGRSRTYRCLLPDRPLTVRLRSSPSKCGTYCANDRSEDLDEIGVSSWEGRADDRTWVLARLDPPAYCYLIAFDSDGRFRLADPPEAAVSPSRRSEYRYSPDSSSSHRATYPAVPACRRGYWWRHGTRFPRLPIGLPPRLLRWNSVQAEGVWRFDGRSIERLQPGKRRVLERMFDSPRPFAQLLRVPQQCPRYRRRRGDRLPGQAGERLIRGFSQPSRSVDRPLSVG